MKSINSLIIKLPVCRQLHDIVYFVPFVEKRSILKKIIYPCYVAVIVIRY